MLHAPCNQHLSCCLQAGAKLDIQLMKASKQVEAPTFSCSLVLQRLHGHVSLLDTLKYRLQLLQVPFLQAVLPCSAELMQVHCYSLIALQQAQLDLQWGWSLLWMLFNVVDTTLVQMQVLLVSLTSGVA